MLNPLKLSSKTRRELALWSAVGASMEGVRIKGGQRAYWKRWQALIATLSKRDLEWLAKNLEKAFDNFS